MDVIAQRKQHKQMMHLYHMQRRKRKWLAKKWSPKANVGIVRPWYSKNSGYLFCLKKMWAQRKLNFTISQQVAMKPYTRNELRKWISSCKIASISRLVRVIWMQQEYNPVNNVLYNGSVLEEVLLDGETNINAIIVPSV
jgi:hypothetical protein